MPTRPLEENILKLAMIGCGGYAGDWIDRLAEIPDLCELIAVTTLDPDDPAAQACRAKGLLVYNSVDELLDHLSPETCSAVIVPTSIDSHYEYAFKVVERGFHVLLEKPPVSVIQDLDRLIKLQRESGKFIAITFQHLYSTGVQRLKTRLASGEFGAIKTVRAHAVWPRPESYFSRSFWSGRIQMDGRWVLDGTLGNPLAHLMAEALYLATPDLGMAIPVHLEAELYQTNNIESEDTSVVRIKTKKGVSVFYSASLCGTKLMPICCEIETERAVIRLTDHAQLEITYSDGRKELQDDPGRNDHSTDRCLMIEAIIRKLLRNERPMITVEECRPYMLAWNGAFESAQRPVAVPFSKKEIEAGIMRFIPGIGELGQKAVKEQSLFSELGVEWAVAGTPVDLTEYTHFPSINPEWIDRSP